MDGRKKARWERAVVQIRVMRSSYLQIFDLSKFHLLCSCPPVFLCTSSYKEIRRFRVVV